MLDYDMKELSIWIQNLACFVGLFLSFIFIILYGSLMMSVMIIFISNFCLKLDFNYMYIYIFSIVIFAFSFLIKFLRSK